MAFKAKLPLVVMLFSFIFVFATLAFATRDPDLKQCKHQCRHQLQYDEKQKRECEERCERYYEEKQRRQREEEGGRRDEDLNKRDPEKQYQQCKKECKKEGEGRVQQRWCEQRCEEEYREKQREEQGNPRHEGREEEEEEEEEFEGRQQGKPYVFEEQHFTTKVESDHGRVLLLPKFRDLLRGIKNYRVAILEADPQTFVLPNHLDAEAVFFVANGRGTMSLVRQDKRESFNLRRGDILRIPAGTTVYMVNSDDNEKLAIVKLLQPVSTPGHFEAFFGAGGEDPESFYRTFSSELLEAALNTRRGKIQRLFGQQRQGVIIKASKEQIKAMSSHEEGGIWPFGGESKGPFNLFHKRPSQSNQYGQLYEVEPRDCKELEELDLGVGFANITQGSMTAPYYNSRATKVAIVTEGEGYFEMACPHLASSESGSGRGRQQGGGGSRHQRSNGPSYQKVRAHLRRGIVFVVPAGHPVITVASKNQNLQITYFDINARNNEKFPLAGRRNIINQLEREAKELAFNVPAKEVDEVFRNQDEEFFFKGPGQQHEGRAFA